MEGLLDGGESRIERRRRTPWLPIAGSILLHAAILWYLTGKLEASLPQIQTPFVVNLVEESVGEKTEVQSGQGRTDPVEGEGEKPVPPQEEQPLPQEETAPSVIAPVTEAADPQELQRAQMDCSPFLG